ncbi:hypothetical protein SDC9_148885 [bioreactor metagenome]|uniref:Uncharacterized protein n=1 Tax=bioreactor metagenome TaxID=1076179 RepID=A0A645ELY3_9ZZZZ
MCEKTRSQFCGQRASAVRAGVGRQRARLGYAGELRGHGGRSGGGRRFALRQRCSERCAAGADAAGQADFGGGGRGCSGLWTVPCGAGTHFFIALRRGRGRGRIAPQGAWLRGAPHGRRALLRHGPHQSRAGGCSLSDPIAVWHRPDGSRPKGTA